MPIDEIIADTTDMEALQAEREQKELRSEMASPHQSPPRASLGNVVQVEKTDIQLWVEVGILVVLILIYTRL